MLICQEIVKFCSAMFLLIISLVCSIKFPLFSQNPYLSFPMKWTSRDIQEPAFQAYDNTSIDCSCKLQNENTTAKTCSFDILHYIIINQSLTITKKNKIQNNTENNSGNVSSLSDILWGVFSGFFPWHRSLKLREKEAWISKCLGHPQVILTAFLVRDIHARHFQKKSQRTHSIALKESG
jgi:hypothetical protein